MILVEKVRVFNLEGAIRGMRNPMNSWDKSDSFYGEDGEYVLGGNDLGLAKRLVKSGSDDRKFMRQIMVSMDITAPRFWWIEADQYKIGTVTNSCSTMHRIHSKQFTKEDFSYENENEASQQLLGAIIDYLNYNRNMFNETREKSYWRKMIEFLPQSYNQKRTLTLNYEVLRNMYHARKHHKLSEWKGFCQIVENLPYSELITMEWE